MNQSLKGRPWLRPLLIVAAAFLALTAWGWSSPTGSSPDDDFHLSSIWCAQGERAGLCESPTADSVWVPSNVVNTPCFAFHNDVTGACQQQLDGTLVETQRSNTVARSYPGGFYWVMSWFAGADVTASVLLMRAINAALFVALSALTFGLTRPQWRRPFLIAVGVTIVPLGMFVIPSTNPSSWALFTPLFVYLLTRSLVAEPRRARSSLIGVATLFSGLIAASARADAAIFVLVAFGLALCAKPSQWVKRPLVYGVGAALTLISGISVLTGRQSGSALSGLTDSSNHAGLGLLVKNLFEIPSLYTGALGGWGLGWLDTVPPSVVPVSLMLVIGGLAFSAVSFKQSLREYLEPFIALLLMVLIPLVMSQGAAAPIGTFVQPRYVLPLLALTILTLLTSRTEQFVVSARQILISLAIIVAANALSLYINLARYTTGLSDMALNLNAGTWQPVGSAFGVLIVGIGSFLAVGALGYRWLTDDSEMRFSVGRLRLT